MSTECSDAAALDATDPLAWLRQEFHLPLRADGTPCIYLCGHSLGLQPKRAAPFVGEELERWATLGVEGHFEGPRPWLSYHEQLTRGLASLVGALPLEVVAMNSLTVNLHLMLASFYRPTGERNALLIEQQAFPSDRYAVASVLQAHGVEPTSALIEASPRANETSIRTEDLLALIEREGHRIATIVLPGVQYLTGQSYDLQRIVAVGHRQGCVVGFDLAHAIGNVALHLHDWNADFAVWCSYKYLNAGPGAIGGCFVHERHAQRNDLPRLAGWWGHDKHSRFAMPQSFSALPGAEGWQLSNPPILSAAPLLASLELFERAGLEALQAKSRRLTAYLESLLDAVGDALTILTPRDPQARGAQLSLRLNRPPREARRVHEQLLHGGVMCDWREPDVIRVAPVPMYNTFTDIAAFVATLKAALSLAAVRDSARA
jgi:kynureninase